MSENLVAVLVKQKYQDSLSKSSACISQRVSDIKLIITSVCLKTI
jgi:hypothetical protein